MKHLKTYEKFEEEDFKKFIKNEEKKLVQRFGDKNIYDFIKDGDLDGIKYLMNNGYDINKKDFDHNLITLALNSEQLDIFEYLLKTNYLSDSSTDSWNNSIDSVSLSDIVGSPNFENFELGNIISSDAIKKLKIITKHGFKFYDGTHNLILLYLCEWKKTFNNEKILIGGVEPFIDWLLENYPNNYSLCKDVLTDELKKKYKHLSDIEKYNL